MIKLVCALATVALCSAMVSSPVRSLAQLGNADPPFCYVDVNNDGVYSPVTDIGPVDQYMLDGSFNTQQSEGLYHAPSCPASLVIPASHIFTSLVPLTLKAGVDIKVYGTLIAPSMDLQACRNIDATHGNIQFVSAASFTAGYDAILDGTTVTNFDPAGTFHVTACRNIYGRTTADGSVTGVIAGAEIVFSAGGCITLDGAALLTLGVDSLVSLQACGTVSATGSSSIVALTGGVDISSTGGDVSIPTAFITGDSLTVNACSRIDLSNSSITASVGAASFTSRGNITGNGATITSNGLDVTSTAGGVSLDSTQVLSASTIDVTGKYDVLVNTATWSAVTSIGVTSLYGDIYARNSRFSVVTLGPIAFYAGGKQIYNGGSTFIGTVTYGPSNVQVLP
jgi:hypothetical protein